METLKNFTARNILASITTLLLFCINDISANETNTNQTIRGVIRDKESRATLIGANVVVIGSTPFLGASTNQEGKFIIENVPLGRVDLKITYLGYESRLISNLIVSAGKQVVLDIEMVESLTKLKEVVIEGRNNNSEALNEMAVLSAHSVSVEETKRFAGSFNDPARMVSSFAGVAGDATGNNDIVVRGNSSKGILWRLEGVEIPNPNHFGTEGRTGGPINALNSNMLSNSDFFTGAFAPEYGNASSGVFDMKLRNGNNQKREYSFGIGVIGVDATAEGPFSKNSQASYLVNYRYSSLGLLDKAKIVNYSGIPKYQDGSFKFYIPTKKAGTFSLFGLGGLSSINQLNKEAETEKIHAEGIFSANLGVAGLNHIISTGTNSFLKSSISVSANGSAEEHKVADDKETLTTRFEEAQQRISYRLATTYNTKINRSNTFRFGGIYAINQFNFITKTAYIPPFGQLYTAIDEKGMAGLLQGFATWKYRISEDLTLVSGLHYMHFMLNNSSSIEPRLGIKWQLDEKQSLNFGYGKHSKLEPLTLYFAQNQLSDGNPTMPNRNLNLAKTHHMVAGYQKQFFNTLNLKTEAYYQHTFGIPVENSTTSAFSMINSTGWFTTNPLINKGQGRNYGMELTVEKYFSKNYFFLFTGSLYQSEYKTLENKWRNTQFNGNFITNFLYGKEFTIGDPGKNRTMGISGKITYAGGMRYSPILLEESNKAGSPVTDKLNPYSAKADNIFIANLAIYYRKDYKKVTHEFKIDIQNLTNHQARVTEYYNARTQSIFYSTQLPMLPAIFYKIDF